LKWCRQGPPGSAVTEVEVNWEPYTGKYTTFEIRY
jgi:acylphosphatase